MINLEEQLTASMREEVGGLALGDDLLGRATRRHRRRTAVIRTGYALGVAGLAGVLAVGLTAGGGSTGQRGDGRQQTVQAQPPSLRLANAAAASDDISYRVKVTTPQFTYEGMFDPRTATGVVRMAHDDGILTELLIDGTRYIGTEPLPGGPKEPVVGESEAYSRYGQYPGRFDRLSYDGTTSELVTATTPEPEGLFAALQRADATITENADGTLHFEYATRSSTEESRHVGDVTLNGDGRIAKVAVTSTWSSTAKGRLDTGTGAFTIELSDYGVAVRVERPKDVVPAN